MGMDSGAGDFDVHTLDYLGLDEHTTTPLPLQQSPSSTIRRKLLLPAICLTYHVCMP